MTNAFKFLGISICLTIGCGSYITSAAENPYITKVANNTKFVTAMKDAELATKQLLKKIDDKMPPNDPIADDNPQADNEISAKQKQYYPLYNALQLLIGNFNIINNNRTIEYMHNIEWQLINLQTIYTQLKPQIESIFDAHKYINKILNFRVINTIINNNQLNSLKSDIQSLKTGIDKYIANNNNTGEYVKNKLNRFLTLLENILEDLDLIIKDTNLRDNLCKLKTSYDNFYQTINQYTWSSGEKLLVNQLIEAIQRPFELFHDTFMPSIY